MGALTDIDQDGFDSAAFHSFPDMLQPDPLTGDNGPNLFGHDWNTAPYIVNHPEFGWMAFGGNLTVQGSVVIVTPRDCFQSRIYVAPLELWLTLDAGNFESVEVNSSTGMVRVELAGADPITPEARLRVEQPAKIAGIGTYRPVSPLNFERNAYTVPHGKEKTWVKLGTGN
jgi:uncharacterized protein DUF5695